MFSLKQPLSWFLGLKADVSSVSPSSELNPSLSFTSRTTKINLPLQIQREGVQDQVLVSIQKGLEK